MKVDLFDFNLPSRLIAQQPAAPRDAARLLVIGDILEDRKVKDLPDFLREGDILVFNDTRVIPARLYGRRGEVKMELLLHRQQEDDSWQAFAKPAKRLRTGDRIDIGEGFFATIQHKLYGGIIELLFNVSNDNLSEKLIKYGIMPLPPYIKRAEQGEEADRERYQTIFAKHAGAVAAPTAGLHFTSELLETIKERGVRHAFITLHVGAGTFQPVKAEDTGQHVMHSERAIISAETATAINEAKAAGGRVVAVGTTSLRTLETAADGNGMLRAFDGETDIFITPGYKFRCADMLLTNFHLPRSTLFMLVSAFSELERMHKAYRHAIDQQYRFYSYGDACLLYKQAS